jgi:hypothetical protein
MSNVEPLWLRREKASPPGEARVQRWENEEARQFMVLPFYEDGVAVPGKEHFMLWGRALSDGALYPIPPHWYTMALSSQTVYPYEGYPLYQWVCYVCEQVSGRAGQARSELNTMQAVIDDENSTAKLCVHADSEIITPEPVQRCRRTTEKPATKFYPDVGLWCNLPRLPAYADGPSSLSFGFEPYSLDSVGSTYPGVCGPVGTYWRGLQDIGIQAASTASWNRRDAPPDYIETGDAATPGAERGDL